MYLNTKELALLPNLELCTLLDKNRHHVLPKSVHRNQTPIFMYTIQSFNVTLDKCPPIAHPACWITLYFIYRIMSSRPQPGCLIRCRIILYPPQSLVHILPRLQSGQNIICQCSDHRRHEHKLQTLSPCHFSTLGSRGHSRLSLLSRCQKARTALTMMPPSHLGTLS